MLENRKCPTCGLWRPAPAGVWGADYLVVGRPITESPVPKAAADAIVAEISAARAA